MQKAIALLITLILASNGWTAAPKKKELKDLPTFIDLDKSKYVVSNTDPLEVQKFDSTGRLLYNINSKEILLLLPKEQQKGAKITEISAVSDNPKYMRIVVVQKDRFDLITEKVNGAVIEVISPKK